MKSITTERNEYIIVNTIGTSTTSSELSEYIKKNVDAWRGAPVIWDINNIKFGNTTGNHLRQFIRDMKPVTEKMRFGKTAIVASKDFSFGMMRMVETFSELESYPIQLQVFRTINEAKQWLFEL